MSFFLPPVSGSVSPCTVESGRGEFLGAVGTSVKFIPIVRSLWSGTRHQPSSNAQRLEDDLRFAFGSRRVFEQWRKRFVLLLTVCVVSQGTIELPLTCDFPKPGVTSETSWLSF